MKLIARTARLVAGGLLAVTIATAFTMSPPPWLLNSWSTFAHSPQHDGLSAFSAQPLVQIKWQTPVDLSPVYSGGVLYIHYGSPLVTPGNIVIVTVKVNPYDTFKIEGRRGRDGLLLWTENTDYTLPSAGWVPLCGPTLLPNNDLMIPAIGGTVLRRTNADVVSRRIARLAFYGIANYNAASATYDANVKINTPLVTDDYGNIYFGFIVLGPTPLGLQSGVARLAANGTGRWVSASRAASDAGIQQVVDNCAPALSQDGSVLYVGMRDGGGTGYLVGLDSTMLAPLYRVRLKDPRYNVDAGLYDEGTASPCVGPDGDVYYGVLEYSLGSNHERGWMLHFDSTLTMTKTPGDFGWDNTASIVQSSAVPSYTGTSNYLLVTKYNNYAIGGGNGVNKVAVLDPNATQIDAQTGATVMREVITADGPTPDPSNGPLAVREWCINDIAVDPRTKSAMVNSEDGKLYRWDFTTNTLSQTVVLTFGIGEAYTPTVIGVDGKVYAINNATLFAVGQ